MSEFTDFVSLSRPKTPNTYLVAPEGYCRTSEPDRISPDFAHVPAALFEKLIALIEREKHYVDVTQDRENLRLNFVAKTPLLKFKDDVDIRVLPSGDAQSQIALYSRSRVGHSDLGANRKRGEKLISSLSEA